jgi:hypothetical protein
VDVHHPYAEGRGRADRAGDGVRDVVVLQVEEHTVASFDQRPDERGTFGREELLADLQAAHRAADTLCRGERDRR